MSRLFECLAFQRWPDFVRLELANVWRIFAPASTPAQSILGLSFFALAITGGIFVVVGGTLTYVILRYRQRMNDAQEPAQIYGSTQVEIAWTVLPVLIVVVLFLTTACMIFAIQDAVRPKSALSVTVACFSEEFETSRDVSDREQKAMGDARGFGSPSARSVQAARTGTPVHQ